MGEQPLRGGALPACNSNSSAGGSWFFHNRHNFHSDLECPFTCQRRLVFDVCILRWLPCLLATCHKATGAFMVNLLFSELTHHHHHRFHRHHHHVCIHTTSFIGEPVIQWTDPPARPSHFLFNCKWTD